MHFLRRQPSSVLQGLANVGFFEIRVICKNLLGRGAVRDLSDDDRHGDAHPTDASATAHHPGIEGNAVESSHEPNIARFPTWRVQGSVDGTTRARRARRTNEAGKAGMVE